MIQLWHMHIRYFYIRCMYFKEKIKARKKYSHGFVNADKNTLK